MLLEVVTALAPMPHAFETVVLSSYEGSMGALWGLGSWKKSNLQVGRHNGEGNLGQVLCEKQMWRIIFGTYLDFGVVLDQGRQNSKDATF